eukprot:Awhi_evm1s813
MPTCKCGTGTRAYVCVDCVCSKSNSACTAACNCKKTKAQCANDSSSFCRCGAGNGDKAVCTNCVCAKAGRKCTSSCNCIKSGADCVIIRTGICERQRSEVKKEPQATTSVVKTEAQSLSVSNIESKQQLQPAVINNYHVTVHSSNNYAQSTLNQMQVNRHAITNNRPAITNNNDALNNEMYNLRNDYNSLEASLRHLKHQSMQLGQLHLYAELHRSFFEAAERVVNEGPNTFNGFPNLVFYTDSNQVIETLGNLLVQAQLLLLSIQQANPLTISLNVKHVDLETMHNFFNE